MKKKFGLFILLSVYAAIVPSTHCRCLSDNRDLSPLELMAILEENKYLVFSERFQRNWLYYMTKENPHFCKTSSFKKNREYYTSVLQSHIKKLEGKLEQGKTGITSWSAIKGSVSFALSSVLSEYIFSTFKKSNQNKEGFNNSSLVFPAIGAIGLGIFSGWYFKKVWRYQERIHERIERDKKVLALFESA